MEIHHNGNQDVLIMKTNGLLTVFTLLKLWIALHIADLHLTLTEHQESVQLYYTYSGEILN